MEEPVSKGGSKLPGPKVPMTPALEALLNPRLHDREPVAKRKRIHPADFPFGGAN